jgi:hypothetical protein
MIGQALAGAAAESPTRSAGCAAQAYGLVRQPGSAYHAKYDRYGSAIVLCHPAITTTIIARAPWNTSSRSSPPLTSRSPTTCGTASTRSSRPASPSTPAENSWVSPSLQ